MFENLKKHIGEKVSYKAWFYGAERNETDTLRNVNYFINIETEKAGIPFVGYGAAISSITLEETGEVLYYNPYIEMAMIEETMMILKIQREKSLAMLSLISKERED